MKYKKILLSLILVMIVIVSIVSFIKLKPDNKLDVWLGRYNYFESFPHSSGQINYVVDYEIIIYKVGKNYYAELTGNGWQLQTRSLAYVEGDENSVQIYYLQTLPGDILYEAAERYDADELLITFTYDTDSKLQSLWGSLQREYPTFSDERMEGAYFEKEY